MAHWIADLYCFIVGELHTDHALNETLNPFSTWLPDPAFLLTNQKGVLTQKKEKL